MRGGIKMDQEREIFQAKKHFTLLPRVELGFFPSPLHLSYSDLAVHEYLGIAWYWLTDRL